MRRSLALAGNPHRARRLVGRYRGNGPLERHDALRSSRTPSRPRSSRSSSPPTRRRRPATASSSRRRSPRPRCRARRSPPGLPADVVNFSIATDMDRLVSAGLVDKTWDSEQVQGHRLEVGRRVRRPQRQPEAHQDVGRPRQARRRRRLPEPVQLRRRALGRHGRLRRAAAREEDAEAGAGLPEDALPAQRLAGHERPQRAEHVPRPGRATCCSTTRATRSSRRRRASPSSTSSRRRRCRSRRRSPSSTARTRPRRRSSSNWLYTPAAQTIWAQNGFRPVDLRRCEEVREAVPAAAAALQDRLRRRLGQGEHAVLRPDERDRREDRAEPRCRNWRLRSHGCRGSRRRALGTPGIEQRPGAGVPQHRRPDPARGARREGARGRLASLLGGRLESRVGGGAQADARPLARRSSRSTR